MGDTAFGHADGIPQIPSTPLVPRYQCSEEDVKAYAALLFAVAISVESGVG